ncbi:hypothetical protein E0H72_09015 [Rhizobium leguminosarum bv. viciae]|uniref:hypothetical protein n=1 Tax=Rhizobium leguminosarum TaxID=384 RepID=UPI00103F5884|nr:hypothetical protein [Rhizobium leguminosarum]TCA44566.1 hypothetical protein E0H72_09015 [Rhizobium leguminosarum bv. viciae]
MRRMWPEEFNAIISGAEEVMLETPAEAGEAPLQRKALKARITMQDYERIWPLAEMRFRLGQRDGKAITLITTNPHYHAWHPKDGGSVDSVSDSGRHYKTDYLVVHFLLDDVKETSPA